MWGGNWLVGAPAGATFLVRKLQPQLGSPISRTCGGTPMPLRLSNSSCSAVSQENTVPQCEPLRGFSLMLLRAATLAILSLPNLAVAQTTAEIPPGSSTPDNL